MTAQSPEILILNGERTSMAFCPPLPEGDPRVIELDIDEIDSSFFNSACWRKYAGTWEIKDHEFYLVNIDGRYKLLSHVPILADWFSGTLRIPQGELLDYVHMGYASLYERDLLIHIQNGCVTQTEVVDNAEELKERQKRAAEELKEKEEADARKRRRDRIIYPVAAVLAAIVLVVGLPFIIPFMIWKHGFNPKRWNLF